MADNKQDFKLIVVVPDPDHGVIDPEANEYYEVTSKDLQWDYHEDPQQPGTFTRTRRAPLEKTAPNKDPEVESWEAFVARDVAMAHTTRSLVAPFGTFLVNMAAFFNTKQ